MGVRAVDGYNLERFLQAQERVFPSVLDELRAGRKRSHWIWFVFPQLAGLGTSAMSVRYAISSVAEARAYLDHPLLGPRLQECARLVNQVQGRSADDIFGRPDNMKVRSSMTLFARAGRGHGHLADLVADFVTVLDRYYDGVEDLETVARLGE